MAAVFLTACSGAQPAAAISKPASTPTVIQPSLKEQPPTQPAASGQGSSTALQVSATPLAQEPQASTPQPASCVSPASLTPAVTEGPYFKAGSPERSSLLQAGMAGTKLTISGMVLSSDCRPVAHALLDFWQADSQGQYDNSGYALRGHLFTDANGRYQLETIVPGLYPGRTEHIHVKVQAPGGPVLTTQLFFPGVQQNDSDSIFMPELVMPVVKSSDGWQAVFNFVVNLK